MPEEHKSFWSTIPGIITAIATLVTAIGGFLVVLNQIGVFGTKQEHKADENKVVTGTANQSEVENLSADEMKLKQMQLEAKLREMEQRMAQQAQAGTSSMQQAQPFQDIAQLHGTWYFDNGAYWSINQSGVSVSVQEYSYLFGEQLLTAGGQGTVIGQRAFIDFTTIGGGSGRAELTLTGNHTLTGTLKDAFGNPLMALNLTRSSAAE
ncbi:MAG TPA: hypothetical protein VNL69_02735 [Bacteroidota bacterium]|nr:hypothetical protein [Bacteroidota bacterium]